MEREWNPEWTKLCEFTCAYLGCILWQGCCHGQEALEGKVSHEGDHDRRDVWCCCILCTDQRKSKLETTSEHPKSFRCSNPTYIF